jgi:hypothetical protein
MNPNNDVLWQEAEPMVEKDKGLLVLDDSTLDKPLWTDGDKHVPCAHRIYDKAHDNLSKNEHFTALVKAAHARGFNPEYVCFDGWYSSLENLKLIRDLKWHWLTRLKSNRLVNPDNTGNVPIAGLAISDKGGVVHLMGYGFVKVFRTIATNGDAEHWASSKLDMTELERVAIDEKTWAIENYHRGIKQFCGEMSGSFCNRPT